MASSGKTNQIITGTVLLLVITGFCSIAAAQIRTGDQLNTLIAKVEKSLISYKNGDAAVHSAEEILLIEGKIRNARKQLEENNAEAAYLEIKLSIAYLDLINANQAFYEARNEYKKSKVKYGE